MRGRTPGDGLLHPVAIAAVAGLVVNDHLLKRAVPGLVTGKLSDVCGLVFFPLLLVALWEWPARRRAGPTGLLAAVVATGLVFVAVKTLPSAEALYEVGLGMLQWPARALAALAGGSASPPPPARVALTRDLSDLIALPALLVPWLLNRPARRRGAAPRPSSTTRPAHPGR